MYDVYDYLSIIYSLWMGVPDFICCVFLSARCISMDGCPMFADCMMILMGPRALFRVFLLYYFCCIIVAGCMMTPKSLISYLACNSMAGCP